MNLGEILFRRNICVILCSFYFFFCLSFSIYNIDRFVYMSVERLFVSPLETEAPTRLSSSTRYEWVRLEASGILLSWISSSVCVCVFFFFLIFRLFSQKKCIPVAGDIIQFLFSFYLNIFFVCLSLMFLYRFYSFSSVFLFTSF